MSTQIVLPKKITECVGAENERALLEKKAAQIGLNETSVTAIKGRGFITLDFGNEMNGGIRILTAETEGNNAVKIRVRFGESLTETYSKIGEKNSTNDHSPRDFEALITAWSDLTFGGTGYRFVRIDFLEDKTANIKSILGTNNILRAKAIYKYRGDDKLVKKIFSAAKRTVDLCAGGNYLWDGVKRDRLVWIGDIHPEMLALTALYGRLAVIERSMDFVREQTPLPSFMNGIPTYSMWWIIIIADYYRYTNCKDFIIRQLGYLKELVSVLNGFVAADGTLNYPYYFVDWPTSGTADEITGSAVINILAARKAIELLSEFGISAYAAEELYKKLLKGNLAVREKKQAAALKYFALGSLTDDEYRLLTDGGVKGFSTFMSYYILTAIASKDKKLAIEFMKEYYGKMLEKGATTFWEDFDVDWFNGSSCIDRFPRKGEKDIHGDFGAHCYKGFRHSLCHGWSGGVIRFIIENC